MLRTHSEPTDDIRRFRNNPWGLQQIFKTPLKDLERFVATFLDPFSLDRAAISTDDVVFEPRTVLQLLERHSLRVEDCYRFTMEAQGEREIAELLEAVLGDWIDFVFVPSPPVFALYADHDEYTTFYAPDDAVLKNLTCALETTVFEPVRDYRRESIGNKWR